MNAHIFPSFKKPQAGKPLLQSTVMIAVLALLSFLSPPTAARADVAPPESPPGSNLLPGNETTQVRMMSETVIFDVLEKSASKWPAQAKVSAQFQMRNLGSAQEQMEARFPLSYWNGESDGFGNFPQINGIQIQVNGTTVPTHKITTANTSGIYDHAIPWAAFPVTFPPGEDVQITVKYTADGYGEYPYVGFRYILDTGADWKDTIGSADLIVRLPYEANQQNVIFDETTGFAQTSPSGTIAGSELRWHYDNLEPTPADNLEIALVDPQAWIKVLSERQNIQKNPNDGEAWGRLGKVYKEISRLRRGFRQDPGGKELYSLSAAAYEKAVALKPKDALWHLGFADLLWSHYYWEVYWAGNRDLSELLGAVDELKLSLDLLPGNEGAMNLADEISYSVPGIVELQGQNVSFLVLTATPQITLPFAPSPTPTETPQPSPSDTPPEPTPVPTRAEAELPQPQTASPTPAALAQTLTETPAATPETANEKPRSSSRLPFCGSIPLFPAAALLFLNRRSRRNKSEKRN
jgi:tetratricopeptide (TPR) repeat protein